MSEWKEYRLSNIMEIFGGGNHRKLLFLNIGMEVYHGLL